MALKKCWECGGEISGTARSCPHCGVKNPGSKTVAGINGCSIAVLIAGAFAALFFACAVAGM